MVRIRVRVRVVCVCVCVCVRVCVCYFTLQILALCFSKRRQKDETFGRVLFQVKKSSWKCQLQVCWTCPHARSLALGIGINFVLTTGQCKRDVAQVLCVLTSFALSKPTASLIVRGSGGEIRGGVCYKKPSLASLSFWLRFEIVVLNRLKCR